MRRALIGTSVLLLLAAVSVGSAFAGEPPPPERVCFSDARFNEAKPQQAVETLRDLMRERDLSFAEAFDYGTAWFLQQRWERAVVAYETAARETSQADEKALAYLAAAQSAAMGKCFAEAGALANVAHRLAPENGSISAYRVAFWSSADDRLELKAAEDAAKRLNIRMEGREVCEPGTIIAIACFAAATVISLYAIHEGALTPDDIMKLIRELMFTIPSTLIVKKMLSRGGALLGSGR